MIHFQCRCGRRLSVSDEEASGTVTCPSCGDSTVVPAALADVHDLPTSTTGSYDFDEEIAAAAREARPRATKTPERLARAVAKPEGDADASMARRPTWESVESAGRWLGVASVAVPLLFVFAGVSAWIAEHGTWVRAGLLAAAAALAVLSFAVTRVASLLCRSFSETAKERGEGSFRADLGSSPSSDGESPPGP